MSAHAQYVPPPPGVESPPRLGTDDVLDELLEADTRSVDGDRVTARQYCRPIDHAVDVFSTYFGPPIRALEMLDAEAGGRLRTDLGEVSGRYNRATDGTAVVENQYRRTIATAVRRWSGRGSSVPG